MTIAAEVTRTVSGVPLTFASRFGYGPWADSPTFPVSVEQAPVIALTPEAGSGVRLQWTPESGDTPQQSVWLTVTVSDSARPVRYLKINWQDGGAVEVIDIASLTDFVMVINHVYSSYTGTRIVASTYDASDVLIETTGGSIGQSFTADFSSYYGIHQYRIERFRGRIGYSLPGELWIPDWTDFDGSSGQMDFYDTEAYPAWNWGYRLWLREFDVNERPGIVIVPSDWVQTGSGEGV